MLLDALTPYKDFLYAGIIIVYSLGVWHVSSNYTASEYRKEKLELQQKAIETTKQRQELADQIGVKIDTSISAMHITQTTINREVIHEITKEPVYTNCITTPDGVRLIESTISNRGQPTTK